MVNKSRRMIFFREYMWNDAFSNMDKRMKEKTEKELKLVECSTCYDTECVYRNKDERFPPDAGGKGQCLRWAQDQYPICWRNVSGEIVAIPPDVMDAIVNHVALILKEKGEDSDD